MQDNPDSPVSPWDGNVQPERVDWPKITFPRRSVWQRNDSDKDSASDEASDVPSTTAPVRKTASKTKRAQSPSAEVQEQSKASSPEDMDVDAAPIIPPTPEPTQSPLKTYARRSSRLRDKPPAPSVASHSDLHVIGEEQIQQDVHDGDTPRRSSALDLRPFSRNDPFDSDRTFLSFLFMAY